MGRRVAVIGAGPAGCAAAHTLARAGREVVVFESADSVGGRTVSWQVGSAIVDSGAGFFTNFYPTLSALLGPLGLGDRTSTLSRTNMLVHEGRAVEMTLGSVRSFLGNPLVSKRGLLRMATSTGMAGIRHRGLDLSEPETLAALDDRSVRDEALATLGEQVYEFLVRPGIEPFWYFACEDVSRSLFFGLQARAATARFFTMRDGMGAVSERLVDGLEVRTDCAVSAIEPDGAGVRVDGEAFEAAVLATTTSTATRLAPSELTAAAIDRVLTSQHYVPNIHATFRVARAACPPEATFFPCGPGVHPVAAVSFNSHKRQGELPEADELVSVYLGAAESAKLLDRSGSEIYERTWALARELVPALPSDGAPMRLAARAEAIPVHGVGRYRLAADAQAAQKPPLVFAGDYLATATVDGSLRSGIRAAEVLLG